MEDKKRLKNIRDKIREAKNSKEELVWCIGGLIVLYIETSSDPE
jgi:hypothetical protein